MGNADVSRSESDHARPMYAAPRFLARSACRRGRSLCRLPASGDQLGDFLSALFSDLLKMLVAIFLGDGVPADLSDATVKARAVEFFDLLPALLSDLLVEVRAVSLRGRLAALLSDLLIELRAMSLRGRRTPAPSRFGDGHRSLVPRHRVTLSRPKSRPCAPRARCQGGCKSYASARQPGGCTGG